MVHSSISRPKRDFIKYLSGDVRRKGQSLGVRPGVLQRGKAGRATRQSGQSRGGHGRAWRLDSLCDSGAFRESRAGADLPGRVDRESLVAKVDLPQALH